MRVHRPHGPAPTTLEGDVLKLRAFEIVLVLFYMEDLKKFIIESIGIRGRLAGGGGVLDGISGQGKKLEAARKFLVDGGAITQAESDEIHKLVDYRNTIGHQIQHLTADVGAYSDFSLQPIEAYDYKAAKRARELRKRVPDGMMQAGMPMMLSFRSLQFETAERVYLAEIRRLTRKVNTGIDKLNKSITATNGIIKRIPQDALDSASPGHPRNIKANGTLSAAGVRCAFALFDAKATPLAVAYLMRISYRAASSWFKKWQTQS